MFSVTETVTLLKTHLAEFPERLIVLGSGWSAILAECKVEVELGYDQLFGVAAGVPGHQGKLVIGKVGKQRLALMAGRFHTYEGYTTEEVTRPIQAFAQVGLKEVVITAAAGALNEKYHVGDFIFLSDMITAFCSSPLKGAQFQDLSEVFDLQWRHKAVSICATQEIPVHEGVYVYTKGPHFETPADKMFFHHLGADVVGMSTVPETIMARWLKLKVLGLAYVTNLAFVTHDHKDVLAAAEQGSDRMVTLLKNL
jgi:purine-nucleoside phosphorylase